jgi:hypothetical protein
MDGNIFGVDHTIEEAKKTFYRQDGIGKAKYTISFHDGKKKHKDGSAFFDIKIFNNKKARRLFVKNLESKGYVAESIEIEEAVVRPLGVIASEIRSAWGPKVNFAAKPYLDAMQSLNKMSDNYYQDSAKSIVLYFLANARTWRGPDAKRIKAELKRMAK